MKVNIVQGCVLSQVRELAMTIHRVKDIGLSGLSAPEVGAAVASGVQALAWDDVRRLATCDPTFTVQLDDDPVAVYDIAREILVADGVTVGHLGPNSPGLASLCHFATQDPELSVVFRGSQMTVREIARQVASQVVLAVIEEVLSIDQPRFGVQTGPDGQPMNYVGSDLRDGDLPLRDAERRTAAEYFAFTDLWVSEDGQLTIVRFGVEPELTCTFRRDDISIGANALEAFRRFDLLPVAAS